MMNKKLIICITSLCSLLMLTNIVKASVTDILTVGNNNINYNYKIDDLIDSINKNTILYYDFCRRGRVIGYYDNKINKYINFDKIIDAYNNGININDFTEHAKKDDVINIYDDIHQVIEDNNKVVEVYVPKFHTGFSVKSIY